MDLAGNARETATLLPGADIEERRTAPLNVRPT
jgi:hypothetical protein